MRSEWITQAGKYGTVGAVGYLLDVGLFNLLAISSTMATGSYEPFLLKSGSTVVAVGITYILNARWTFKGRNGRPEGFGRIFGYALVNAIGLLIILASLGVSRYVLGFDSLVADNVSANVVGVILAWIFRFYANRKWVFLEAPRISER